MHPTNYWLFKTEPTCWSWQQQIATRDKTGAFVGAMWDGVRNYQARNFMRAMAIGDLGFFYHTGKERRIVGIVEVTQTAYPDPTSADAARWDCVDVKAVTALPRPVTLEEIKACAQCRPMALVTHPRLSVQPVAPEAWDFLCELGGYLRYQVIRCQVPGDQVPG